MAAIFDLRHNYSSNSIIIFNCVFYGTENVSLPLKLCCYHVFLLRYVLFISAAILDFWLPVSFGSVTDNTVEMFDPENIRVAVGILFLVSLEAEIPLGVILPLQHKRH